jgi:hypothetical protein
LNMVKRIEKLTEAQSAQMAAWADKWIEVGLRTGPADRVKFMSAAERCYEAANIPWHRNIVWVSSPLVMAIAAPVAALVFEISRRGAVDGAVYGAVDDAVRGAVYGAVDDAVDGAVRGAVDGAVDDAVDDAVRGAVRGAVDGAVDGAVRGAVDGAVHDAVRGAVDGAVRGAVRGAVDDAVDGAVDGAVHDAVRGAVDGAVRGAVRGAVYGAVDGAVDGAVRGAVYGAVDDAVRGAVHDAVDGAVRGAVHDAVGSAVGGAVDDAVDGAVRGAVGGAVDDAVDDAKYKKIRQAVSAAISTGWRNYLGGQFWIGGWYWGVALTSFFREVCDLEIGRDLWERGKAHEAIAESACCWYPHKNFIMVCERPTVIHCELVSRNNLRGFGSHRLHADNGPAISWPDGWGLYVDHGVRMPFDVGHDRRKLTVARIDAEVNAEVRRVMIKWYGVDRYMRDCGAQVVHEDCDQLANPRRLLWRDQPGDEPIVLIEVTDSTPQADGSLKKYILRVDPKAYGGRAGRECHAAIASTWRHRSDPTKLMFKTPESYCPLVET